jgi:hypothetical protein
MGDRKYLGKTCLARKSIVSNRKFLN